MAALLLTIASTTTRVPTITKNEKSTLVKTMSIIKTKNISTTVPKTGHLCITITMSRTTSQIKTTTRTPNNNKF